MLTDYHLHLRPDDPDTPPSRYFTSENAARYRAAATAAGIAELGVAEHIHRFVQSLDIWDHEWWTTQAFDDVDAYCAFVREDTDLRLGIEADFLPGKEDRIAAQVASPHVLVRGHPFVDVWQAVKPAAVGIERWPDVPKGQPWKAGVISALGWQADEREAWGRILGSVDGYADLEPALLGRVEQLIDFVTEE